MRLTYQLHLCAENVFPDEFLLLSTNRTNQELLIESITRRNYSLRNPQSWILPIKNLFLSPQLHQPNYLLPEDHFKLPTADLADEDKSWVRFLIEEDAIEMEAAAADAA